MGTVLLTGAGGFVGRHLLTALRKRGYKVRSIVRNGQADSGQDADIVETPDLFAMPPASMRNLFRGVDLVIHAAWYTDPTDYLHSAVNLDCLSGTLRLVEAAEASGVRRFVGIGTAFEYARATGKLRPEDPLGPSTLYGAAKASAYMMARQLCLLSGMEFAWCRLFSVYGPGENSQRLIPLLRERLSRGAPVDLTSGTQVRDYLEVREAAQQIVELAASSQTGPLNVCSGIPVTVRQVAEQIADEYGRRDLLRFGIKPDRPGDPMHIVGVPSHVRSNTDTPAVIP